MNYKLFSRIMNSYVGIPDMVEFSIRNFPERTLNWQEELIKGLHFSSMEEMLLFSKSQYQYLEMSPVAPLTTQGFDDHMGCDVVHAGSIASIYVLARCSERLFLKKRPLQLSYDRLNRRVFIQKNHIGVLAHRRKN